MTDEHKQPADFDCDFVAEQLTSQGNETLGLIQELKQMVEEGQDASHYDQLQMGVTQILQNTDYVLQFGRDLKENEANLNLSLSEAQQNASQSRDQAKMFEDELQQTQQALSL